MTARSGAPSTQQPSGAVAPFKSKTAAAKAAVDRFGAVIEELERRLALVEAASQPPGFVWQ